MSDRKKKTVEDKIMEKNNTQETKEAKILCNCKSGLNYQFSKSIRKLCKEKNIKGEEKIKEILDISPADLSEYKMGKKDITLEGLENLANKFETSPYFLLGLTDNPAKMPTKWSSFIWGLSLEARYFLMLLYFATDDIREIEYEIVDDETGEINAYALPSGMYAENFEILSSLIADFSNFCDFFTYIKSYVDYKQKTPEEKNEDVLEIKEKIQKSLFDSLDKFVEQKRKEDEK